MDVSSRPSLHFTAALGWINDPLALTWAGDRYHLFFQHVPGSAVWSHDCRWGHAVSTDLLLWRELPIALEPGEGDGGVWSGSLVLDDTGSPTIFYTSVQTEDLDAGRIRSAVPADPGWVRWEKGPVLVEPPAAPRTRMFRDPFVLRDGDRWRMLVGAALEDGTGAALGYSSTDLVAWRPDGVVASRRSVATDLVWTGSGWECPQIIEVDGVHVLVISVWEPDGIHHVAAASGVWEQGRFEPRDWQQLTYGDGYYAGAVFRDRDGRPCMIMWIRGAQSVDGGASWAGALSVPHLLVVRDGVVGLTPHPDVRLAAAAAFREVVPDGTVSEPGWQSVALVEEAGHTVVSVGDLVVGRMPGTGACTVLVDGPVVEVWSATGAIAAVRSPTG